MNTNSRWLLFAAATVLAAVLPAQDKAQLALARAQLLEQQEGDLAAAQAAYRTLLADAQASAVHGDAALRLGSLLWRLDDKAAAKPFLDRAVAAGGDVAVQATAVLQGQGPEAKLAQERLDKARALVARYRELAMEPRDEKGDLRGDGALRMNELARQMPSLAAAAATALVEALQQGRSLQNLAGIVHPPKDASQLLLGMLWRVGTAPAQTALSEWAADTDVAWRRQIAASAGSWRIATDLTETLLRYVRDPDPTGEVWQAATRAVSTLEHDVHVALLREAHPNSRAAALQSLATTWENLSVAQQENVVANHGPTIVQATRSDDGRVVERAWQTLREFATKGPRTAMALFLMEAARYPGGFGTMNVKRAPDIDDPWLRSLCRAAQSLTTPRSNDWRQDGAAMLIAELLKEGAPRWASAGVDDALTLLELGYGDYRSGNGRWAQPCVLLANPEQLGRLVRVLPNVAQPHGLVKALAEMRLPESLFPALRDAVEACLPQSTVPWANQATSTHQRTVRGRSKPVPMPSPVVVDLIAAAAATGAPAAATWLGAIVDREPSLALISARLLVTMSGNSNDPAIRAALRRLLVWPGTHVDELQPQERSEVFAELARVGDVAAIPLFVRAYELGLAIVPIEAQRFQAAGIGFLGEWSSNGERSDSWHGYAEADLQTAWRTLLDSNVADKVWAELPSGHNDRPYAQQNYFHVPAAVLPLLCQRLAAQWAMAGDNGQGAIANFVQASFGRLPLAAVEGESATTMAIRAILAAEDEQLKWLVFGALPREVAQRFATEARQALRKAANKYAVSILVGHDIPLDVDEWREVLRERGGQYEGFDHVPAALAAALRSEVTTALANPDTHVRFEACQAMRRLYGADAVADLLPLVQDTNEQVRKAARESLDQLREEHERRTFWADAGSGIDVRPASAAAKLLAQAKAGEAKDQRLMALRSLGVLSAAEALPYLIDWTKDPDVEIAAAARAAIAQIHAKAGAAVPPADKKD